VELASTSIINRIRHFSLGHTTLGCVMVFLLTLAPAAPVNAQSSTGDPAATPPANPVSGDATKPCFNGLLRVSDLETADTSLKSGMAAAETQAKAWQSDARLNSLQLDCPLLSTGYSWNGTYFSESRQAFFHTGTEEVSPSEDDPSSIPTLDLSGISFRQIYRSLLRAGYTGDLAITAAGGVTIRENIDAQPFGPSNAPKNVVYAHLAIEDRNEIKDIWVDVTNGTVYRYEI